MVEILTLAGVVFGGIAVLIAVYSRIKQQDVERQLKRKEELSDIAELLYDLIQSIKTARNVLDDPLGHPDLSTQLDQLGKEVLAIHHETEQEVPVIVNNFELVSDENEYQIDDWDKLKDNILTGGHVSLNLTVNHERTTVNTFPISEFFFVILPAYEKLDKLRREHGEILDEFEPGLLDDIEDQLDSVTRGIAENIIDMRDGSEYDPEEYESNNMLAVSIYFDFLLYEKWGDDYRSIAELSERIEEVRSKILQASYS